MSIPNAPDSEFDDAVRSLLLLMPRMVGRLKRIQVPDALRSFDLTPRHMSMLAYLLFDGALTVNALAQRLEVAPTTVSLMVGQLSRNGVLERREDEDDRRRKIISIAPDMLPAIRDWLSPGATAWRQALSPLTPEQRRLFVDTMHAYESAVTAERGGPDPAT